MFKMTFIGGCCIAIGFFLFVFKGIAGFMERTFPLPDMTIEDVVASESLEWIGELPWEFLQSFADRVVTTPLYLHCFIFGAFFLVIGGFRSR